MSRVKRWKLRRRAAKCSTAPARRHRDATTTMIYTLVQSGRGWRPKPRRRNVPLVTLPVSDVASTAGAPTLPSGVSQCIWASPPRYALQRHENSAASARVRLAQPGYTELCEKIAEF